MQWLKNFFGSKDKRAITYAMGAENGLITAPSRSRVHVTELTALGVSAVWCAVKVISEAVGSLPLIVYQKQPNDGRRRADDNPLYTLLHDSPNPEMTRNVFFEVLMSHALLHGTFIAEIERDKAGNPIAFWPINPQYVQTLRNTNSGELLYRVTLPMGVVGNPQDGGKPVILRQSDVLAVPGISPDGSAGYALLQIARDNIGFSIAADRFGASYFGNSARLGGMLTTPNRLSDEGRDNLKKSFRLENSGVDNSGHTPLLEEGLKYEPLTYKDDAGLYNTTRQFQVTEVARLFNISPVKLHELGRATWSNLSVLNTDFYITTLRPWLEKIESELERKLMPGTDYYCEFLADSILRGDTTTRYAAYKVGIDAGFLHPDEVRGFENLPPLTDEQKADMTPAPVPVAQVQPDNIAEDPTDTQTQVTDKQGE